MAEYIVEQEKTWPIRRSTSDGLLIEKEKTILERGRSLKLIPSAPLRRSHRKIKSLVGIENDKLTSNMPEEAAATTTTTPNKKREVVILICLCAVDMMTFAVSSIKAPFFPKEAAKKGITEAFIGAIFSFYALVMFFSSPLVPKLVPYTGPRFLLVTGLFMNGLSSIIYGFMDYVNAGTPFGVLCLTLEGMGAVGATAYSLATYIYILNIFPHKVGSVTGLTESFVALGMSLGPVLGGVLYHVGGFGLPFYVLGGTLLLSIPLSVVVLPTIADGDIQTTSSYLKILKNPTVILIGIIVMLLASVWSSLDPILEPHLREFELTPEGVGLTFLLFSILYGISTPLWGYLSDSSRRNHLMMTTGLFVSSVALLVLGPAPFLTFLPNTLWVNLVALSLLGVSMALSLLPTFPSLFSAISNDEENIQYDMTSCGMIAGLWSCFYTFGEVVGPLSGALITERFGFAIFCTVMASALFTLGAGSLIYFVVRDSILRCRRNNRYGFRGTDAYRFDTYGHASNLHRPILTGRRDQLYTVESAV